MSLWYHTKGVFPMRNLLLYTASAITNHGDYFSAVILANYKG